MRDIAIASAQFVHTMCDDLARATEAQDGKKSTDRGETSGSAAILIPPGWKLDRTEVIQPGRIVMAVVQDRYSTISIRQPTWSGRAKHSYGHLLFLDMANGVHDVQLLQIAHPEVIPHVIRCEGLLRVLSWVSFDLPTHLKGMVGELLQAAGKGNTDLHKVVVQGRDIRDAQPSNEAELQAAIISMIPIPGGSQDAGGQLVRDLLVEFLKGFSLRTLLFLLDMVLPRLDAYHAGRHLQHLQPWASVELMQQQLRGQRGTNMRLTYQYEGFAGFHALQLYTDGAPVLLFCASADSPQMTPKELCEAGRLGNMEANVMAGMLAVLHLSDSQCRCVLLLVHEKVLQSGTSKTPDRRAFKRIPPSTLTSVQYRFQLPKASVALSCKAIWPKWRILTRCKIGRSPLSIT